MAEAVGTADFAERKEWGMIFFGMRSELPPGKPLKRRLTEDTWPWWAGMLVAVVFLGCRTTVREKPAVVLDQGAGRIGKGDVMRFDGAPLDDSAEKRVRAAAAYATGISRQMNADLAGALKQFEAVVRNDPEREDLALEVARLHMQRREFSESVRILAPVSERADASLEVFTYLGVAHLQQKQWDDAARVYAEALRRKPDNIGFRALLSQVEVERGRSESAWKLLLEGEAKNPTNASDWLALSDSFLEVGKQVPAYAEEAKKRAGVCLTRAEAIQPDSLSLLPQLAERFSVQGRTDEAEKMFLRLQEKFPENPFPAARLAEMYIRSGRITNAVPQLERIRKALPANPIPVYYLGLAAVEQERYSDAETNFIETIRMNATFEPAYHDLAGVQLGTGRATNALQTLTKARALFPASFRTEYIASLSYSRLEQYPAAVKSLEAAEKVAASGKETNRLDHRFYFQLGAMQERAGDFAAAERSLKRSLSIRPDYPEALNHLGYSWADRGEHLEEALAMIRRAVDAEPENEAYLDSLAWVLFKLKRPAEARPWMEKAIELSEKPDATMQEHLGDILAELGEWKSAREAWNKALSLEPTDAVRKKIEASANR